MTLPRLVLTRKQCDGLFIPRIEPQRIVRDEATVTVPERPMMPCPDGGSWGGHPTHRAPLSEPCSTCGGSGSVPVLVGTRIEVGWWAPMADWAYGHDEWHSIATATVAEVQRVEQVRPDLPFGYEIGWHVTITHINNHDALTIHTNWHHQIDGTPSPWAT